MKNYNVIYQKIRILTDEFEAENLEDAKGIAELKRPEGYEVKEIKEVPESIVDPIIDGILDICRPK